MAVTTLSVDAAAQLVEYQDEAAFLAAVDAPTLIDFEGIASPGESLFLSDPGEFSDSGVTITNNSQMFVQNIDAFYGTGSFLSPQGANPQVVQFSLPPGTVAIGFSYSYANYGSTAANPVVSESGEFFMPPEPPGGMGFFGVTRDTPIDSVIVTVTGGAIDFDNVWFAIDPSLVTYFRYTDEADFLAAVNAPALIDFEGYADPGNFASFGDPGQFSESGVTFTNNSQMFIQNSNFYGTQSYLSPQGANPQIVQIVFPAYTTAFGFSYRSAAAMARVSDLPEFSLLAVPGDGSLRFFGVTNQEPMYSATITVQGTGLDIDNFWFVVDAPSGGGGPNVPGGGEIDTNFGTNGVVMLNDLLQSDSTGFFGLGVQPGGGIILAGVENNDNEESVVSVVRIDQTGGLDSSFGVGGIRSVDIGSGAETVKDMAILDDGSILIVGSNGALEADGNAYILKLDADGDVDTTFGTAGVVVDNLFTNGDDEYERIFVQDDGKLLLGTVGLSVWRSFADGSRDFAFGGGGIGRTFRFGPWAAYGLVQTGDGKIIFGGGTEDIFTPQDFLVGRYVADGLDLDNGFGDAGIATVQLAPDHDSLLDMVLDDEERIVALGYTSQGAPPNAVTGTGLTRLLSNGSPDPSFGTNGIRRLDDIPNRSVFATRVIIRPDGGLLVAGKAGGSGPRPELFIVSLNEDGTLDETFAGQGWQELDTAPDLNVIFLDQKRAAMTIHPAGKIIVMNHECECVAMLEAPDWKITRGDQDGDNKADILLRNSVTGANQLYVMNGTTIAQNLPVSAVSPDWDALGRGDYNGDGKSDILWRYAPTGALWIYFMDGKTVLSSQFVATVSDSNWEVVGNGDYNGDLKSDILWRHAANGTIWLYAMNGSMIASSTGIGVVSNSDWKIVGSGDYNGDGKSDVLWRNSVTGTNWMYLMNGSSITTSTGISVAPDANWRIVGNGDLDGNGKSDVLWRHATNGTNWAYLMNGTTIATSGVVSVLPDANWIIAGDGDYNGDGMADVLWRNQSTGSNYIYLMNGFTINTNAEISTVGDQNWQIANPP